MGVSRAACAARRSTPLGAEKRAPRSRSFALSEERARALAEELESERALGFDGMITGYFRPGMRANYASMIPERDSGSERVLEHEYTHYLVGNRDQRHYPLWIEEALAALQAEAAEPQAEAAEP
jgi:hypothetical protein